MESDFVWEMLGLGLRQKEVTNSNLSIMVPSFNDLVVFE